MGSDFDSALFQLLNVFLGQPSRFWFHKLYQLYSSPRAVIAGRTGVGVSDLPLTHMRCMTKTPSRSDC